MQATPPTPIPQRPRARRRALALVGLALLVGTVLLPGSSQAAVPALDNPLTPVGQGVPPKAPVNSQNCFEQFFFNSIRCKDAWCDAASFFWFDWTDCNDGQLANCLDKANQVFACCMAPEDCEPKPGGPRP